jgi:CTP synthase
MDVGRAGAVFIHLTLVPFIGSAGEQKTKPTQHSVRELRAIGIQPDILLCRADRPLSRDLKSKIALFCNVDEKAVITAQDVDSIYEVPLLLGEERIDEILLEMLQLPVRAPDMGDWRELVRRIQNPVGEVTIGVVGKYVSLTDAYKSLNEALSHGGVAHNLRVRLTWIEAEDLEQGSLSALEGMDGILVPGGFGPRGTEGMAAAAGWARRNRVPYFGICYGFQWAVVEYARSVCGLSQASSTECHPDSPHKVILKLRELLGVEEMGGTMRLGAYECVIEEGSLAHRVYGKTRISERHRHRYEFNQEYEPVLSEHGLRFSGRTPDGKFVEIAEIPDHPWFIAVQFHPEFKSRPLSPHPLFREFIGAAFRHQTGQLVTGGTREARVESSVAGRR